MYHMRNWKEDETKGVDSFDDGFDVWLEDYFVDKGLAAVKNRKKNK